MIGSLYRVRASPSTHTCYSDRLLLQICRVKRLTTVVSVGFHRSVLTVRKQMAYTVPR